MALGLCCQWLEPRLKRDGSVVYENAVKEKGLQLGRFLKGEYSPERIRETYRNNIDEIIKLVPKLVEANIKSFRLSSGLLPLFDLNEDIAKDDDYLLTRFDRAGKMFIENGIRVTAHPGQYTLLSSDSESVIERAIGDLSYHAWMFDCMGLDKTPYSAINIHGGKADRTAKLIQTIHSLPYNVRSRLTLENDEIAYSLTDLLPVYAATGVPIVWDTHHHLFNDGGLSLDEAFPVALSTWITTGCKPLQHLSNTIPGLENSNFVDRRKHSDLIHTVPECQLEGLRLGLTDVDIEAKMKNVAISDLIRKLKNTSIQQSMK